MDSTIKLLIKIDGNFKEVEVSADELAKAISFIPLNPRSSKTITTQKPIFQ